MRHDRGSRRSVGTAVSFLVLTFSLLPWIGGCGGGAEQPESQPPPAEPAAPAAAQPEPEIVENLVFVAEPENIRSGYISAICLNVRGGPGTATD